jgi:hypothetical protein
MKTFTIEQLTVNKYTIRDDAKPTNDYATYSLIGMLSVATRFARLGYRLVLKTGNEERVIIAQEVAS